MTKRTTTQTSKFDLTREQVLDLLRQMCEIRLFEETVYDLLGKNLIKGASHLYVCRRGGGGFGSDLDPARRRPHHQHPPPLPRARRVARRMVEGHSVTAPVTLTMEADATEFVALRERLKARLAGELGFGIGHDDPLIKWLARCVVQVLVIGG